MIAAYSRARIDMTLSEQVQALLGLCTPGRALGHDLVPEFERRFAQHLGVKEAVSFPSCRSAMFFALKALEFEPGDEVILPAFAFWVDAAVVKLNGLTPVFADVDLATMNLDPAAAEAAITDRTRAIFPTHLNGLAADLDPLIALCDKHNLRLIEDCARSCGGYYKGRRVGTHDVAAFSFGYGKSFYAFGGGMLATDDVELAQRVRSMQADFCSIGYKAAAIQTIKGVLLTWLNTPWLYPFSLFPMVHRWQVHGDKRFEGLFKPRVVEYQGAPPNFTVRMNNQQARLGLSQMGRIDASNAVRLGNLNYLNAKLNGVGDMMLPFTSQERPNVGVHYAVWSEHKDELQRHLLNNRVDAQNESALNTTQLDLLKEFAHGPYPNAEKLDGKVLLLPTHPQLSQDALGYIAKAASDYYK